MHAWKTHVTAMLRGHQRSQARKLAAEPLREIVAGTELRACR